MDRDELSGHAQIVYECAISRNYLSSSSNPAAGNPCRSFSVRAELLACQQHNTSSALMNSLSREIVAATLGLLMVSHAISYHEFLFLGDSELALVASVPRLAARIRMDYAHTRRGYASLSNESALESGEVPFSLARGAASITTPCGERFNHGVDAVRSSQNDSAARASLQAGERQQRSPVVRRHDCKQRRDLHQGMWRQFCGPR
jgi:hypothetical protein